MKKMAKMSAMTPRIEPIIICSIVSTTADERRLWNEHTGIIVVLLEPPEGWA
jgi:hypothetical protein